ncbi:N-alpha-acetyltransferase 40 [Vanrija pseudolonga]|uniref:N-alpha-acetyltransferase 40 n=1 Tax=Vanrija pseudolonga TaxID=143232 RepID=A0AAF0Y3V7_9TREE|nr:N-alpha-acetyltransferase 40 [Vanrija pseudolonga]
MATPRVRSACSASPTTLAPHLPRPLPSAQLALYTAAQLSPSARDTLYALLDANMAPLAAGTSMEHEPLSKRAEMFDKDARYLVLTRTPSPPMPGALPPTPGRRARVELLADELLGFASFRFDTEETCGAEDAEVIYCYEVQLAPDARGLGLGAALMAELEGIGARRGMAKAMLTCLASNTTALHFYTKAGYTADEIDPTRMADDEEGWEDVGEDGEVRRPDYRILSKEL